MKVFRITSLVLAVLLMVSLVSCGDKTPQDNTGDIDVDVTPVETTAPVPEAKEFALTADFAVIRPDEADDAEVEALQLFIRGIKSAYGIDLKPKSDFIRPEVNINRGEYEIIIGNANRPETAELGAVQGNGYYDWDYRIVSEKVIAICGGSPEATLKATRAFLRDVVGYEESDDGQVISAGSHAVLSTDMEESYRHDCSDLVLKIGERSAGDYTVVAKTSASSAQMIALEIGRLCGKMPDVVSPSEFEGGPAIFLGCADKKGGHLEREPFGASRYYITASDEDIIIDCKSSSVAKHAADIFVESCLHGGGDILAALSQKELTGVNVTNGLNGLVLNSSMDKEIARGVTYTEQLYYDPNGAPVRVYLVTVKAGAGKLYTSLPSDGMALGSVQNMQNQINAAESNGKTVIAGVNADFFDMGGSNVMRGLCIKNGVKLTGPDDRPWFGVTFEGEPVIGVATEYPNYEGKLENAVGGSHVLLKNDIVKDIAVGTDFADIRHPRTAVGFKPGGDVVLMVVDGRQSTISNGASLADLAWLFGLQGCSDAVNLDGGGSTTMIIREDNQYVTKNSPSDGWLRSVANGLLVLAP